MKACKCGRSLLVGISVVTLLTLTPSLHAVPVLTISQTDSGSVYYPSWELAQDFTTGGQVTKLTTVSFQVESYRSFDPSSYIDLRRGVDGSLGAVATVGVSDYHDSLGRNWITADFTAYNILLAANTTYDLTFYSQPSFFYTTTTPSFIGSGGETLGGLYDTTHGNVLIGGQYASFEIPGAVPEPNSMAMLLLGAVLVGGYVKLQRRNCQQTS